MQKKDEAELVRLEAEKSHAEKQLRVCEDKLQKLETEKSTLIRTNKELRESLERKVAGLQAKLEEADELVTRECDSMQREHALTVAALQEKLAEKNEKDRVTVAASSQVCYCLLSQSCFHWKFLALHSVLLYDVCMYLRSCK